MRIASHGLTNIADKWLVVMALPVLIKFRFKDER
jgi:hypothetical protein